MYEVNKGVPLEALFLPAAGSKQQRYHVNPCPGMRAVPGRGAGEAAGAFLSAAPSTSTPSQGQQRRVARSPGLPFVRSLLIRFGSETQALHRCRVSLQLGLNGEE